MGGLRIGICDEEEVYVRKLAAYLNRNGRRGWNVSAFTDEKLLQQCMEQKRLDLIAGTKLEMLKKLREVYPETCYIWLTEQETQTDESRKERRLYPVYRYQSASMVKKSVEDVVDYAGLLSVEAQKKIALYSPIGRCGKTSMALDSLHDMGYGKWLYIGMEDYSFLEPVTTGEIDQFFYFVKERRKDALSEVLKQAQGVLPSPFSPFDTRQIDREDLQWLFQMLKEETGYHGLLFDIGTGVLQNMESLLLFDDLVVPCLTDEKSVRKKEQFVKLLTTYGFEELKMWFINMENPDAARQEFSRILRSAG